MHTVCTHVHPSRAWGTCVGHARTHTQASDPEAYPGLAHFCEHMLFLGTEAYPQEDAYTSYLEQHGGECNAFTAHEHTHYYFDVQPAHLRIR